MGCSWPEHVFSHKYTSLYPAETSFTPSIEETPCDIISVSSCGLSPETLAPARTGTDVLTRTPVVEDSPPAWSRVLADLGHALGDVLRRLIAKPRFDMLQREQARTGYTLPRKGCQTPESRRGHRARSPSWSGSLRQLLVSCITFIWPQTRSSCPQV